MKQPTTLFSIIAAAIFTTVCLAQCGGGGGGGGNPPATTYAAVIGTVGGTTVIAYDQNNNEAARSTAAGNPKTFSLSLPTGVNYKFYLIENEGTSNERVYPLYQGSVNVFSIGSAVTIDLGYVDTVSGIAVPANNPLNAPGVGSNGEDTTIPPAIAGSAFTPATMAGTWNYVGLVSGYTPTHQPGWYYGSFTFDASGLVVSGSTITESTGPVAYTPQPTSRLAPLPSGVISDPSVSLLGQMNRDKNMIVATATMAPGGNAGGVDGFNLLVMLKSGTTFTASDYIGTWSMHWLTSGATQTMTSWAYGELTMDGSGTNTWTSFMRSDGYSTLPPASSGGSISIDGILSNPATRYHGVTTPDKRMIISTMDDSGSNFLIIMQKKGSETFSLADLQGTWTRHTLAAGDGNRWIRGIANIDSSGVLTWASMERSNGNNTLSNPETLSISPDGVVTSSTNTTIHGVLSWDKRTLVSISTDETVTTRYKLTISQK